MSYAPIGFARAVPLAPHRFQNGAWFPHLFPNFRNPSLRSWSSDRTSILRISNCRCSRFWNSHVKRSSFQFVIPAIKIFSVGVSNFKTSCLDVWIVEFPKLCVSGTRFLRNVVCQTSNVHVLMLDVLGFNFPIDDV